MDQNAIWFYNRDAISFFVQSTTKPIKLTEHKCISINFNKTVAVSVGKGWGVDYKRPSITDCPLWIEINFTEQ